MQLDHHTAPTAPQPGGPYSHAVSVGDLLFLSGQRPQDPATGEIPDGIAAQAHAVFGNLAAVLESCRTTFADVVKVQVYLAHITDFDAFNAVYRQYLHEPYPARTTVGANLRGILVEVDLVACRTGAD